MIAQPLAVIDIGSNSGRIIVVRVAPGGHLEILSDARTSLRLMRDVDRDGGLSVDAERRTLEALRDFMAVATGAGARRIVALATSAVREARNGAEFVQRLRRATGLDIRIITGDEEARLAFIGALNGLAVNSGVLLDVGGGSLELLRFRDRRPLASWSLPFGSLRLSDMFLLSDPPRAAEVSALQDHVSRGLHAAGLVRMGEGEQLVGTGGTIRNLAKMHRLTADYPIPRLHGYTVSRKGLREVVGRLTTRRLSRRAALPGLSSDRADSIAGGGLIVQTVLEVLGAGELVVSGQGLREGAVYEQLTSASLPSTPAVRRASITAIASRFSTWDAGRARRRSMMARALWDVMANDVDEDIGEALEHAATMLDVGRSVDYYRRWDHAAEIVVSSDLYGFSHRSIALIAALIARAGKARASFEPYGALCSAADRRALNRAAVLLALADEVERRMPPGTPVAVEREDARRNVVLTLPVPNDWMPADLKSRFARVFGRDLSLGSTVGGRQFRQGVAL